MSQHATSVDAVDDADIEIEPTTTLAGIDNDLQRERDAVTAALSEPCIASNETADQQSAATTATSIERIGSKGSSDIDRTDQRQA